jgi:hypothetical protein
MCKTKKQNFVESKEPKQNESTPTKEMGGHFLHFIM